VRESSRDALRLLGDFANDAAADQAASVGGLSAVRSNLKDQVLPELDALAGDFKSGRLLLDPQVDRRLAEMREKLAGLAKQVKQTGDAAALACQGSSDAPLRERIQQFQGMKRAEKAGEYLAQAESRWLGELRKKVRVLSYRFDAAPQPLASSAWREALALGQLSPGASGESSTNLAAALEQVARDAASQPVEAVMVWTDGQNNAGADPLRVASAMSALPMLVVPIGNPDPVRDAMLHHVQGPNAVFLNDQATIEGTVDVYGCAGEEVTVELLEGSTVVDRQKFIVGSDSFVRRVTFSRKAETLGRHEYKVRVQPLPRERVADNNEAQFGLDVIEDKVKVLVADNLPRWEYRFLCNLLKRDERAQFQPLLIEPHRDAGRPAQGTGLPKDLDGWAHYNVVILGDLPPEVLNARQQTLLEEYVAKRGGTVIVIAGDASMPAAYAETALARMLPVSAWDVAPQDPAGFSLFLTGEGQTSSMLQLGTTMAGTDQVWRNVTTQLPIYSLSLFSKAKPTSHVLIGAVGLRTMAEQQEGQERPVFLAWQQYGRGKVVYLSAPVTYQLRFAQGDPLHYRFWGQLLRWSMAREMGAGSKTVRITTDKADYTQGEKVQVAVRLTQAGGLAETKAACSLVARLDGKTVATLDLREDRDVPGTYVGTIAGLPTGQVRLQPAGARVQELLEAEACKDAVEAVVRIDPPNSLELRSTRCNLPLLTQLAQATNGLVLPPTAVAPAMERLSLSPEVTEHSHQRPLWNQWWCLWLFLGCLTAEWTIRKFGGLS
jgi:hypothetical protein